MKFYIATVLFLAILVSGCQEPLKGNFKVNVPISIVNIDGDPDTIGKGQYEALIMTRDEGALVTLKGMRTIAFDVGISREKLSMDYYGEYVLNANQVGQPWGIDGMVKDRSFKSPEYTFTQSCYAGREYSLSGEWLTAYGHQMVTAYDEGIEKVIELKVVTSNPEMPLGVFKTRVPKYKRTFITRLSPCYR